MRNALIISISTLLILLLVACSTSNVGVLNAPQDDNRQGFAVTTEPGTGSFTPELVVDETATGVTVSVRAEGAEDLSAAYLHVQYDQSKYTPLAVEVSDFIGTADETLSLAVTSVAGDVAVGMTQIAGATAPRSGDGLLATISFANGSFVGSKVAASAPAGNQNSVNDLTLTIISGDLIELNWSELNIGDYDNNGEVAINDLTPLGQLFGENLGTFPDSEWATLVDGDGNGELNIADVSPIGANFGNVLVCYHIYTDAEGTTAHAHAMRSDFYVDSKNRVLYNAEISIAGMTSPTFTVRPGISESDPTVAVGPTSNPMEFTIVPGPPEPPLGLVAISGEAIGHASIKLNWAASMSADVKQYEVERKLNTEDNTAWTYIKTTSKTNTEYVDADPLDPLGDVAYDYRVRAMDFEDLFSEYSDTVTETPWLQALPAAPENLVAVPGSGSLAIALAWDIPAGVTPLFQTLYTSIGTPDDFDLGRPVDWTATDYTDLGLTEGTTYYYYLTLTAGGIPSDPSNQASSICSPMSNEEIQITDLSTDKVTFNNAGADGVGGNIVVTTDEPSTNVIWSDSIQGVIAGENGTTLNWTPPGSAPVGKVTVTCEVFNGGASDSDTIELILTALTIKTTYTYNQTNDICGGDGKFIDFSAAMTEQPNEPYKNMSDFLDGEHVVTLNLWDIWCPPCRAEMPEMHTWAVNYKDDGYFHVGVSSTYSLSQVEAWQNGDASLGSPAGPYPEFHFFNDPKEGTGGTWTGTPIYRLYFTGYGLPAPGDGGSSLPRSMLFDKDGYCRRWDVNMVDADWDDSIEELLGL